jgi:hypothetical protein
MLAALAIALSLAAGHSACTAERRLNAEQTEQRLDEAAVSPPSMRRAERARLVAATARKLSLTKPDNAILPGVAPSLMLGRADLFRALANKLRDLCPEPAPGKAVRPKVCGARRAHLEPAPHVTPIDQTEQGFILWIRVEPGRARQAQQLAAYLHTQKLDEVAPLYQVLRTASDWQTCGGEPFALPPRADWPRAAKTLAWIQTRVKPAIGPVEVMSGFRDDDLNACAQGAKESAHLGFWALDMEPIDPLLDRATLMNTLCRTHKAHGQEADIGLGFYQGVRFHIDDKRYRHWGFDPVAAPACAVEAGASPTAPAPSE